jgi:hypothetical protein
VCGAVLGVLLLGVPAAAAAASESAVPVDAGTGAPEPTAPAGAAPGTEPPTPAPSDAGGTDAAGPPTEPEPSPSPSPVEPEPPVAAPTPAADAPAPAPDQPDRLAGDSTEPGQEDPVGDDRGAAGDAPSSGRDEPSAAPAAGSGPAVDDPGSTAEAPQPPPARLTAVGTDAAPASDRTTAHGQRAAHTPVLIAPRRPDSAKPRTPVVRHGPQRGMAPAPALFGQPVAAPATAAAAEIPQSPGVGSSRAGTRDHPPKHAAPHRAHGEPATPAPTTPPGGVVQAAASAAGGGSAAPELPCILLAIIATSGTSALQRHRIALIVPTPSDCSIPLERPG